jgi:hypothetical protein
MRVFLKFTLLVIVISVAITLAGLSGKELIAQKKDKEIETAVDRLLSEDYEFELTRFLVVKEGSEEPDVINLEDVAKREFVSSKELKKDNSEKGKNIARLAKLKGELLRLSKDKKYKHVQPSYIYTHQAWTTTDGKDTPNDFSLDPNALNGNHWYYERSKLRELWNKQDCANGGEGCGGSSEVVVAVIDTGLAFQDRTSAWVDVNDTPFNFDPAPDMFVGGSINLWVNEGEIPGNNVDDDGNGFVDDVHGANTENHLFCFYTETCKDDEGEYIPELLAESGHPDDDGGHGTYVTGLIASLVDNGSGSVSPAHNVKIMPIKASLWKSSSFGTLELWWALHYAQMNGADIVNMSLAGTSSDSFLENKINALHNDGILVIAASGNGGSGVMYPAKYSNVIAVGAVNANGSRSSYSSYGPELDLVAYVGSGTTTKGDSTYQQSYSCFAASTNCYSSTNTSRYTQFSNKYVVGTSFAAPQVAAAAAIILGNNPGMSVEELRLALGASVDDLGTSGRDNLTGVGVINFYKADSYVAGTESSFFPEYIVQLPNRASWTITANPSESTDLVYVNKVNNQIFGPYTLKPSERKSVLHNNLYSNNLGPLEVLSDKSAYTTQVSRVGNSYYQIHGTNLQDLTMEYFFPEYIVNSFRNSWLVVGNPSTNLTNAVVNIEIGQESRGPYEITPGNRTSMSFKDLNPDNKGPVRIISNVDIYSSQVNSVSGSFNQIQGIKISELTNEYFYPEYIVNSFRRSWVVIGNPSASEIATVNIKIGDETKGPYTINPGDRISQIYFDLDSGNEGPVKITSDVNIYTSQVSSINGDFYQMVGLIPNNFVSGYYYPEYIVNPNRRSWIVVGNPSLTESVSVNINIGGVLKGPYVIEPESRISRIYFDLSSGNLGPAKVTSSGNVYSVQVNSVGSSYYIVPGMNL